MLTNLHTLWNESKNFFYLTKANVSFKNALIQYLSVIKIINLTFEGHYAREL